jgi:hypothetical protein
MGIGKDISGNHFLTSLGYPGDCGTDFGINVIFINKFWKNLLIKMALIPKLSPRSGYP